MKKNKSGMLAVLAMLFAGAGSAFAGITNGLAALETELTNAAGTIATSMATVAIAGIAIFGVCFIVRVLKKVLRSAA